MTLTVPAFAKINWRLRVLGKRTDGYHELETIFQTISLHDTITFQPAVSSGVLLTCNDRSLSVGGDNLICRAATALQARFAVNQGARAYLEKRIPAQAGLGGGAADAAVTLLALNSLWRLRAKKKELLEIACTLGADVPFFLFGGAARGGGIGAELTSLDAVAKKYLLVVKPNANVPTALAYQSLDSLSLTSKEAKTILSSLQPDEILSSLNPESLQNDFEPVVFELAPEIERAKTAIENAGAEVALLAGSGAAVFGIFNSESAQERAIQTIKLEAGWRVFPCSTVGREEYGNALGDLFKRLD